MEINYWNNIIDGDKEAFLTIYHKHYKSLFYYGFSLTANRELAKDCIQELFLDIWNTRSTLNKDVENVQSYLFTWLRRKISRIQSRSIKEKSYQNSVENNETREYSYEELLTKKQLEIVRLKFFDNLSYAAIAEMTSLTTRTIYNIIHEAIHRLRENMKILL